MPGAEVEALFWAAGAVLAYTYAGYPLLLGLLARLRPAPAVRRADSTPEVSLIIVAHNEEANLEVKLRNCLDLEYPRERLEVLVVSDGSTDRTEAIAGDFASRGVRLLALPGPNGKPAALNRAVPQCRGEILVLCDARQRMAPDAVRQLVANLADPTVGAVSGELHIAPRPGAAAEGVGAYWRYEKLIRRTESRFDSTVGVTGAIYALRSNLFRPLDPRTLIDDVAIPMEVVLAGYRVLFEPLAQAFDEAAGSAGKEYRRKVRTLAGNYQLIWLRPALLDPRKNRLLFQLVSHKLLRLLGPWCLLTMAATSGSLAVTGGAPLYRALVAVQAAFYALAAWGRPRAGGHDRPRIASIPYAFVLLNLAAAAGLFGFLSGRVRVAWKDGVGRSGP